MSLVQQLHTQLKTLVGHAGAAHTLTLSADKQIGIAVDLTAVDSMSCAVEELRLTVPGLASGEFAALKNWAERLSSRVTYLLENIGPLELDPNAGQVLVRSTAPDRQDGTTRYYEILLESHAGGTCTVRRYRFDKGAGSRTPVAMSLTHEVLTKLLTDLVETAPDANG